MYGQQTLQDFTFLMLYGCVGFLAIVAALYLLLRRNKFFAAEVQSSLVLRRWTSAFFFAMALSHVWWYVFGVYWLTDDRLVRNITVIMLDHVTLVPLVMIVLLVMLQDRRRPLWPWLLMQLPVVIFAVMGIDSHDWFYGYTLPHYWQLSVIVAFIVYYILALQHYGRWLCDNYADLERKEVWQSLVFALVLFAVYELYTTNVGETAREYLSQVLSIAIIAFLLWRVETLQELHEE